MQDLTPVATNIAPLLANRTPEEQAVLRRALEAALGPSPGTERAGQVDDALAVAGILQEIGMDADTLAGALLAAIPEPSEDEGLREGVPGRLAAGVARMGAMGDLLAPTEEARRDPHQAERLRNLLVAMVEDVRAVLIKLAAELHRARGLRSLPEDERHRAARAALDLYAPLASRLGVRRFKWELEDLAFRALEPDTYMDVARRLQERRTDREQHIDEVVELLSENLAEVGIEAEITGRSKHIYSIWRKMRQKSLGFDEVFDLRAVRVLVDSVADCYSVLGVVHTLWTHVRREFDDYITHPKPNGYRSLHTAVIGPDGRTLEVQIRTHEMHRHAEFGVAAHWRYKEGGAARDPELEARIAWMRQLLEPRHGDDAEGALFEGLSTELLSDRVYVVTPRGQILDLPAGSTPLDFAYQVHTDVGHRCRGAKVNGAIVPLHSRLESGDQVEILTTRQPGPSRDWLNPNLGFLKSARSRAKVRHWFKQQDYEQNLADGQDLFQREVKRLGVEKPDRDALAGRFNFVRFDDLLAALGRGEVSTGQIAGALQPPQPQVRAPRRVRRRKSEAGDVRICGVGNLLTTVAQCCKPVPPEGIVGFITRGRGVTVHREDCANALRLATEEPARIMEVSWQTSPSATYPVDLALAAWDRRGLLRDITAVVTNEDLNLLALNLEVDDQDGEADVRMTVEVPSMDALGRLVDRLGQLRNVTDVRRMA